MNFEDGGITVCDIPSVAERALSVEFPHEEVERSIDGAPDNDPMEAMDAASEAIRQVFAWVWQPPCADLDGLFCRTVVVCWVFVPQLREYTMTEMAERVGKKKQSLGRWVEDFKRQFPAVTDHLQHIKNT